MGASVPAKPSRLNLEAGFHDRSGPKLDTLLLYKNGTLAHDETVAKAK